MGDQVGHASSGTLIAAALETAGYHNQQLVLQQLGPLLESLGVLIFIVGVIGGLITALMYGRYQVGLQLLVAPALFHFLLNSTTLASGTEWQFGAFDLEDAEMEEQFETILDPAMISQYEVSTFFDVYNRLISSVYQQLIHVITDSNMRKQMKFMTRQRMLDFLFRSQIDAPELKAFVHEVMKGPCYQVMQDARTVAIANRYKIHESEQGEWSYFEHNADYIAALARYNDGANDARLIVDEESNAGRYLQTLFRSIRDAGETDDYNLNCALPNDFAGPDYNTDPIDELLEYPLTCRQTWCWMFYGLALEVRQMQSEVEGMYIPENADDEMVAEIWEDLSVKLVANDITEGGDETLSMIPMVIAGAMIRKEFVSDVRSNMYSKLGDHSGIHTTAYAFNPKKLTAEQMQDVTQKIQKHVLAKSQKYEVFEFAMALPYIQGVILYALATAFPFFALLLLIPGKQGTFLTWVAFWSWAKFWDVGWAMVMVADDVLWELMPHYSMINLETDPAMGPTSVFESAFQADPSYSLSHYYMILGMMISAVPLVSAKFILGTKAAMATGLTATASAMAKKVGVSAGDWAAHDRIGQINKIATLGSIRYAAEHMGENTPESQAVADKANQVKNAATVARGGMGLGAFLGGLGGTLAVFGGRPIAGTTLASGGTTLSWKNGKASVDLSRAGQGAMTNVPRMNAEMAHYNYTQTREFLNLDGMRSGISNRGEFWNPASSPVSHPAEAAQIRNALDSQLGGSTAEVAGAVTRATVDGATRR